MPHAAQDLLVRDATLRDGRRVDVRIAQGRIAAIGTLEAGDETVLDAAGGLLIPGLHDHHLHIAATAAAAASVSCGPPDIVDASALRIALARPGEGWLRGVGYHESVAGLIDRHWLDTVTTTRPVRVQHRSGRMWTFNSLGLDLLRAAAHDADDRLERDGGGFTGRLFDADAWLRRALGTAPPCFAAVGRRLARFGVTGVTDMTVANGQTMAAHFAAEHDSGALPQRIVLAGSADLADGLPAGVALGPLKVHLHEAHLPDHDTLIADIATAHAIGRTVAVHCVTEVELVFTLAAFAEAGVLRGDRIEHASLASDALADDIAALGLIVVTQPNFIAERGDAYLRDLPAADWPNLYRLQGWHDRGVTLAAGTDAPFGDLDPWAAIRAATTRRTRAGAMIASREALSRDAALDLFLADPDDLARTRTVALGAPADLCLLSVPWAQATLSAEQVRATIIAGRVVHDGVDQPDRQRGARGEPAA